MKKLQLEAGETKGGQELTTKDLKALLVMVGSSQCKDSFRALFDHFAPRLKSFFLKIGTNEGVAEELVQETFVQVWRKAYTYNPEKAAVSTWIFTIARNRRIDRFRSEKSFIYKDEHFFSTHLVVEESQNQSVFETELGHQVRDALFLLPANQAEIIRLSFFQDLTHSEIAQNLSLPLGTVKSRIRLAFKQLRTILAGLEI
ncbi:MAG: sigma-70 family RNA polymerase sigma factor [Cohaesibacter sp.]|nr:sigma-70 family RNA polymerase sigma factor [Cohaesibacter sp.]